MRKYIKLFAIISSLVMSAPLFARSLSNVERDGNWYRFYDETGKRYLSESVATTGELVGWSSSMVIFKNGNFFYVYDVEMKNRKGFSIPTYGEVIAVSGNTFTTRLGNWIYTYDRNGKKLNSRAAH
ncbi:MAG: hypothetical protein K2M53_09250 [Muribaculaceae bacterium]|nr:hypothetical protein [Muribaculaceae bacterium]